jgi:DNA-binding NtrC family response regulator
MPRLLVIDDDASACRLVRAIFAPEGIEVEAAGDGATGLERVARDPPDVVILDLQLPEVDGLEVLERLRRERPALPVIMLTAHTGVKSAVQATRLGAFDYLTKPFDTDEIVVVVRRALETSALKAEVAALRKQVKDGDALAGRMGPGPQIARLGEQVEAVAASSYSVLVLGETGTGKELVAQAIHRLSDRRDRPFIALDCGAIPEALLESELFGHERGAFTGAERRHAGRFQLAHGGTLFLDEIGNLPLGLQAKLLRVLESRELTALGAEKPTATDVRFVAATNEDLQARVTSGKFRADLYFRLAQYTIRVPALRARTEDLAYLAKRFLDEASVELRRPMRDLAPDAIAALARYPWPGNVRELRNVIRQAVLESRELVLHRAHVQKLLGPAGAARNGMPETAGQRSLKEIAADAAGDAERQAICDVLAATRGNKSQAARALRTDYKTLHLKMKALGIRARDFIP